MATSTNLLAALSSSDQCALDVAGSRFSCSDIRTFVQAPFSFTSRLSKSHSIGIDWRNDARPFVSKRIRSFRTIRQRCLCGNRSLRSTRKGRRCVHGASLQGSSWLRTCSCVHALVATSSPPDDGDRLIVLSHNLHQQQQQGEGLGESHEGQPADLPLPTLQVQSWGEQEALAATPAHGKALKALYGSFALCCSAEHSWRFIWPACISLLHHSLLPIAVLSFVGQLVTFVAGPWVGEMMDRSPRVLAFQTLSFIQTAAMLLSAALVVHAFKSGVTGGTSAVGLFCEPWFVVLALAGAVERMAGLASGVAFERDWVVQVGGEGGGVASGLCTNPDSFIGARVWCAQLAGPNRPIALAKANAILRRVDLTCEVRGMGDGGWDASHGGCSGLIPGLSQITGPLCFGWLLSHYPPLVCLTAAATLMLLSLPLLIGLVFLTDHLSSGVLHRPKHSRPVPEGKVEHGVGGVAAAVKGWRQYCAQPVLPASLAYVLLYFNAVLAPGGLMTSYLTQQGLPVAAIGVFRGVCAAMGFAATFVSAPLIATTGVLKAGAVALLCQSAALVLSVAVCLLMPAGNVVFLSLFLALVALSRLGYWTYDCIDAQIFQTAIPGGEANLVGTTEVALQSLAEVVMLGIAIVVHDVAHFGVLSVISCAAVVAATAIYCAWLAKPNADQKRLFPNEPQFRFGGKGLQPGLQPLVPSA